MDVGGGVSMVIRTDPDEFRRFHELLTKDRPDYKPYYIALREDGIDINGDLTGKKPVTGMRWWLDRKRISADDAIRNLEHGMNVAIVATENDSLTLIDIDDLKVIPVSEMKPSLSTISRSRMGGHFFYFRDDDARLKKNVTLSEIGEIRTNTYYVVAPGSYVRTTDIPTDQIPPDQRGNAGKYTIENAAPVSDITYSEIPQLFRGAIEKAEESNRIAEENKAKREKERAESIASGVPDAKYGSRLFDRDYITIYDVIGESHEPQERFKNPLHPGARGTSAAMSEKDGTIYLQCYSHGVSHTPQSALAVLAGIADCADAGKAFGTSGAGASCIDYKDGRTQYGLWHYAKKKGIIPADDPMPRRALVWYAVENGICKSDEIEDNWLPAKAYNEAISIFETEEGMSSGRDKIAEKSAVVHAGRIDESMPYGIEDGCFVKYEQVKDKNGKWVTKPKPLCNFSIDLQTDTLSDDGITAERWWEGEILVNGHRLPFKDEARKFVTPADYARVLVTAGGSALMFENRNLQDIRHAMQGISTPLCRNIRQTFGLLDIYKYETPSIMIDRDGVHPTETRDIDLSGKGNSKHLDMQVLTDAEFRAVGEHIRDDLLHLHIPYVINSLTGFTFLAPFNTEITRATGWTGENIGLVLIGTTGSGKTFDAVMYQWFFGDFSAKGAITSWTATPYEIQVAGYYFKDVVYLVDDFKLSHFRGNPSRYASAIGILQNYTDGTARDRLTSDIKIREGQPIQGGLIVTGEDFPHNEASIEGRYHVIPVIGGEVNREKGHRCLMNRHYYSGFMARYIAWVFQKGDYGADIVNRINGHRNMFINGRETAINIDRLAQSFAYNLAGYELFCHFMSDCGFVDAETARNMIDAHKSELNADIDAAVDAVTSATAGGTYLEILSELIASGRFKIHDWDDWHTVRNKEYEENDPDSDEMVTEPLPLEDLPFCIGFDDEPENPYLYIIPNIAFAEVCRVAATQGMPFTHTQTGTGKELIARGVMMEGKGDGIAYAKWYQNRTRKVWKIVKHAINYNRITKYAQMEIGGITK